MDPDKKTSHALNVILVLLTLILVALVVFHVRQKQKITVSTPEPQKTAVGAVADDNNEQPEIITVTATNIAEVEVNNAAIRPPEVPGSLAIPAEAQRALLQQTRNLLQETHAQPDDPDQRRALVITEQEALQMQKEGRLAY